LLWGTGEDLQAVYDHGLFAASTCHDDRRAGTVTRLRLGHWDPSPCAAAQAQSLWGERTPQASQIVARPPARRPAAGLVRDEQCGRFATLHRASYQAHSAQGRRDRCP
jgi:hypothetical protein